MSRFIRIRSLRKFFKLFLPHFASLALIACEPITETVNNSQSTPPSTGGTSTEQSCYLDTYRQPDYVQTRSMDILFVTDTSGSLDVEREEIANGIDGFVRELPAEVDFRIAVMLGHSSRSNHSHKLYKHQNNPYVMDSTTMSMNEIRTALRNNLTHTVDDRHGDGGEEMLYSLAYAFENGNLRSSQAHGFFRENAALAIVFITDENDICYPGVVPDFEGLERPTYERDCLAQGQGNSGGTKITAEYVMSQIRTFTKDRPFLVSGIYYSDRNNVPQSGENEFGLGVHEIINLSRGIHVNMANGHYDTGLSDIGKLAVRRLQLNTSFQLSQIGVNPSTIQVMVDGRQVAHQYDANTNVVTIRIEDAGTAQSKVEINYCKGTGGCTDPQGCNVNPCDLDPNSAACAEFCVTHPQDLRCIIQNPCQIDPTSAACTNYCTTHPEDPLCCQGPTCGGGIGV